MIQNDFSSLKHTDFNENIYCYWKSIPLSIKSEQKTNGIFLHDWYINILNNQKMLIQQFLQKSDLNVPRPLFFLIGT